jgi:phage tail sheath protein FI
MRLSPAGTEIINWATDNGGTGLPTADGLSTVSPYLGVYYPCGQTNDLTGNTIVVPPTHMALRTILRSDAQSYPWFAAAGNRRGIVDNVRAIGYVNADTGEFNQMAVSEGVRDTLYENQINPITFIPGTGLVVYGNKTTFSGSALDRINVARLVAYMRDRLDIMARNFLFEPNDKITRDQIKSAAEGFLNDLIAKRAIYDYIVQCDEGNNTPDRVDRNELWLDIAIEPVKSVEFIYIPLRILNTGELSGS